MLNDPTFVEAARVFASRIINEGGDRDAKRLDWAFRESLSRSIQDRESKLLLDLLRQHRDHFRAHPEQAADAVAVGLAARDEGIDVTELAAWTSVARAIFNLNELITRN